MKGEKKKPKKTKVTKKTKITKLKKMVEKTNEYTEYEEFHIEKQLNIVFKLLIIISILLSLIVIFKNKDICNEIVYAQCGPAYTFGTSNLFFILVWIENILAIVFSLYKTFCGIIDGKGKEVLIGIIGILIQPVVWESIFEMLNIIW